MTLPQRDYMSNAGKWEIWYKDGAAGTGYGDDTSYRIAASWLSGFHTQDWGCGYARFKQFLPEGTYTGVDGTPGFADVVTDLVDYQSETEGILIRHVLEHNTEWRVILDNALASAKKRLVIAVFTPDGNGEQLAWTPEIEVPDIAISWAEISKRLTDAGWKFSQNVAETATAYGKESIWIAWREESDA
jgi:hypothetical protein